MQKQFVKFVNELAELTGHRVLCESILAAAALLESERRLGGSRVGFINLIGPIVQKYAKEYGYHVASPIIAQACVETGYGHSSHSFPPINNLFGMKCGSKWKGCRVNSATKEEYTPGVMTGIRSDFRAYPTLEAGIKGYFDFISAKRYAALKHATTPAEYLEAITAAGYATGKKYFALNMAVIKQFNLTRFDDFSKVPVITQAERDAHGGAGAAGVKYIKKNMADMTVGSQYDETLKGKKMITTANLRLREDAGITNTIILTMPRASEVTLSGSYKVVGTQPWYHVKVTLSGSDYEGYCCAKYLV